MSPRTKKWVSWMGCLVIGIIFVGAAIVKFDYILPLEKDVMSFFKVEGTSPGAIIQLFPRLLIGLELALGLALLQPYWRRRLVLPACLLLLLGFAVYLISLDPGKENCGCFGAWLKMGPRMSLFKTLAMLAVCGACWRVSPPDPKGKLPVPLATFLGSNILVFILLPLRLEPPPSLEERFAKLGEFQEANGRTLEQGTVVLCFFSATCDHCQAAARELAALPPEEGAVFLVFLGESEEIEAFRALNGVHHFPWNQVDVETFLTNIGQEPPRIYLLQEGRAVHHWDRELSLPDLRARIKGAAE